MYLKDPLVASLSERYAFAATEYVANHVMKIQNLSEALRLNWWYSSIFVLEGASKMLHFQVSQSLKILCWLLRMKLSHTLSEIL